MQMLAEPLVVPIGLFGNEEWTQLCDLGLDCGVSFPGISTPAVEGSGVNIG